MVENGKIYILGAGITGLASGYELLKKGKKVEFIERSDSVGGLAKTLEWKGRPVDLGPHIYHTPDKDIEEYWKSEFPDLFFERDHWSKNLQKGKFYDYPISEEFIDNLPEKIRKQIKSDLENCDQEELTKATSYYDYIRALAGPTLQEMFFTRYPEKLWGMPTKNLDANWAPKRIQIRKKKTPFYWGQWAAVGNNGSGTIIESLKEKILELGGLINLSESISRISTDRSRVSEIKTTKRRIQLSPQDIVINTVSYTQISKLLGYKTSLKYRGVILVFLEVSTPRVFPKGVDFVYIDDPEVCFNRVSDQNSFVKNPQKDSTIVCCEITYSVGDEFDSMREEILVEQVRQQFSSLDFCKYEEIIDSKVSKLKEVYPMFFLGYQNALAHTKEKIDNLNNVYTLGSLAEYAYSDLQVLFSKAIDLAEIISGQTFSVNKIDKTNPKLDFNRVVDIAGTVIGENQRTFVIAEIGLNHNGSLDLAKKLIDKAILSGASAVKLQSYKSDIRVAKHGKTSRYVEKVLGVEETDYEMLKKNELTFDQTKELFEYAKNRTIIFSTPFDVESVDELENLNIDCYKIASFDLVNLPLIRKVASTGKPLIISTGMSYLSEIEDALREVAKYGNQNVILLQCTSSYPCPPESMNIKAIDTMKSCFNNIPVGLSDHVVGDTVSLAAVARGADVIEKHFTLDRSMEGPDHILSLEPEQLKDMIQSIQLIEHSIGDGVKQPAASEISSIVRFRKTMYAKTHIAKGDTISAENVTYKGPAYGIYAKFEEVVFGRKSLKDIEKDMPITWDLIGE